MRGSKLFDSSPCIGSVTVFAHVWMQEAGCSASSVCSKGGEKPQGSKFNQLSADTAGRNAVSIKASQLLLCDLGR